MIYKEADKIIEKERKEDEEKKMKKKRCKKALAIVLSMVMMVGTISFMLGSSIKVKATPITKDINIGLGGIGDPTSTGIDATEWMGSKVYYGNQLWRVLDDSGFLFSEEMLETKQYNSIDANVSWENCSIRTYLNGSGNVGGSGTLLGDVFTNTEQNAIIISSVTNEINPTFGTYGGNDTFDKLFLLSISEVNNSNYGFGSEATLAKAQDWWLRSSGDLSKHAAVVQVNGVMYPAGYSVTLTSYVRPAFYLSLPTVLFTSASGASKASSFEAVGSNNTSANTWKLTLKDGDISFVAMLPTTGIAGEDVSVYVIATGIGTYSQTSAILEDSTGSVAAYGKIGETGAGNKTFTIPSTLVAGTYTLHVFNEQVNSGNLTDYVSREVTGSITVTTPVQTPTPVQTLTQPSTQSSSLLITNGAGGTHQIHSDGALTMTCSGDLEDFADIYVDGVLVKGENYTVESGSTIVTLKAEYLDGLPLGTHTLTFLYWTGSAETTFTIVDGKDAVPKTGENMQVVWLFALMLVSGAGAIYIGRKKKLFRN